MKRSNIKTKSFDLAVIQDGKEDAPRIAIVIPGRLDTKDYANFHSHVELLGKLGFFAIAFDAPGTWESKGSLKDYTTTSYIQAVNELIAFFGARPTLLIGHSRGGGVAMLASDNPSVCGLVLINASYGSPTPLSKEAQKEGYQLESRDIPPGSERTKEQKSFKLPLAYFKDGEKYNPLKQLEKITIPKLLIHGSQDAFVSVDQVNAYFEKLSQPKELKIINTEHDYRLSPAAVTEVNDAIMGFSTKYFSE